MSIFAPSNGRRIAIFLAGVLMSGPAAAAGYTVLLNAPMPLLDASRPAPAPGTPGYLPAPTANLDIQPPVRLNSGPQWDASIRPQASHPLRPGAGNTSGSDFSESLQRRKNGATEGMAPMVSYKMPLQ